MRTTCRVGKVDVRNDALMLDATALMVGVASARPYAGRPPSQSWIRSGVPRIGLHKRNALVTGGTVPLPHHYEHQNTVTKMNDSLNIRRGRTHWAKQFSELDLEILRQSMVYGIRLDSPSSIDRVLNPSKDHTLYREGDALAHEKLRGLLMLHLLVRRRAIEDIGREETIALIKGTSPTRYPSRPPGEHGASPSIVRAALQG